MPKATFLNLTVDKQEKIEMILENGSLLTNSLRKVFNEEKK